MSPASSFANPEFCIPQLAVLKDNVIGKRPKLIANVRLKTRGWSSFKNKSYTTL